MTAADTGHPEAPAAMSLIGLLEGFLDYAGLFPPAALSMEQTVTNYARDRASDDAWMLSRLIVPCGRLDEFEQAAAALLPTDPDEDDPWELSVLTVPAGDDALPAQLDAISAFNDAHDDPARGLARIETIELRAVSPGKEDDASATASAIDRALDLVSDEIYPWFELPWQRDPRGMIAALADAEAGAKIRTGGVTADLYPTTPALARFISACASARVAFKATAGLHHPLRHHSSAVGADEFGFLNVFLAGVLARRHEVEPAVLEALLEERDAAVFGFGDEHVTWREYTIDLDGIDAGRACCVVSFGSCSFDEPREDLRELGLLR